MTKKRDVKLAFEWAQESINDVDMALAFLDYIDNFVDLTANFSPAEFTAIYQAFNNQTLGAELTTLLIRLAKRLQSEMSFNASEVQALLAGTK